MSSANDGDAASTWLRVKRIAGAALDQPPEQREAFVASACQGDAELRRTVQVLLSDEPVREEFLQSPIPHAALRLLEGSSEVVLPADRFDRYRIERVVGSGGLGTVYRGHVADDPEQPPVAIKVLRRGMASDDVLRRFRQEQQLLARLDHPHIARFIGSGTTEHGLNYLVMEYVDGQTIDGFCDERSLSIPERLRLFDKVCAAVQYSHRNLIVHRDLKPSNILVIADGTPKLLDFGIAKLIEDGSSGLAGDPTITAQRFITPQYASPEQVAGGPITTASDVYSLGVVLYELLSGHRPYDLSTCQRHELPQALRLAEPIPPSTRILQEEQVVHADGTTTQITPASISQARASSPERLRRELTGDLDTIVLTAMHRDLSRRYTSVEQLAEDITRHLQKLPIRARPERLLYRTGKFIRRNRVAAAALGVAFVSLAGGAAGLTIGLIRSQDAQAQLAHEAQAARREASRAQRINDFYTKMLAAADPVGGDKDLKVIDVLNRSVKQLKALPPEDSDLRATLHNAIGINYQSLKRFPEAKEQLEAALELRIQLYGEMNLDSAATMNNLAGVCAQMSDLERAEVLSRQVVTIRRELLGPETPEVAKGLNNLANVLRGQRRTDEALAICRQALQLQRKLLGPDHTDIAASLSNMCGLYTDLGRRDEAIAVAEESLQMYSRMNSADSPHTATVLWNLAELRLANGDRPTAELNYKECLRIREKRLGDRHPDVANVAGKLGRFALDRGDYAEAERLYTQAMEASRAHRGIEDKTTLVFMNNLGQALLQLGKWSEAEDLARSILEVRRRTLSPTHKDVFVSIVNLAELLSMQGRSQEATGLLSDALQLRGEVSPRLHREVAAALSSLGTLAAKAGSPSDAETLYREALEVQQQVKPAVPEELAETQGLFGDLLASEGRYEEAEALLISSCSIIEASRRPGDPRTVEAIYRLVNLYEAWGQPDKAAECRALLAESDDTAEPVSGS